LPIFLCNSVYISVNCYKSFCELFKFCSTVINNVLAKLSTKKFSKFLCYNSLCIGHLPLAGQWQGLCIRLWRMHRRMRRLCHFVKAKWQMVYLSDFQSVNFVVFGEVSPQQSIAQMENKGQEDSYSHFFPRRCCYFFDSVVVQKSH